MLMVMLVAPSTTWLLVRISPVEVRMIPVPAAWPDPRAVTKVVLMSTTDGATWVAMAAALTVAPAAAEGAWGTAAIGALVPRTAPLAEAGRVFSRVAGLLLI